MPAYRAAGQSDSDSDSDSDILDNFDEVSTLLEHTLTFKNQAPGEMVAVSKSEPVVSENKLPVSKLNSKKKRSMAFHKNVRSAEIASKHLSLRPVKDPKNDPKNRDYFNHARQTNLGRRSDLPYLEAVKLQYSAKIQDWKPLRCMAEYSSPMNATRIASSPLLKDFKGYHVYWIDSEAAMVFENMIKLLETEKKFAIDMEFCCKQSYNDMTSLIQIATAHCVFLIDPFSMFKSIIEKLKPLFEDANCLKIMHGMANDFKHLMLNFGIYPIGLIDTQLLHNTLRVDGSTNLVSLNDLAEMYLESYTRVEECTFHDFRRRPLTSAMAIYAANDVLSVYLIYEAVTFTHSGRVLKPAFKASKDLMTSLVKSLKEPVFPTAIQDLQKMKINVEIFIESGLFQDFLHLHQWRLRHAAITDVKPAEVVDSATLLKIVELRRPIYIDCIRGILKTFGLACEAANILMVLKNSSCCLIYKV